MRIAFGEYYLFRGGVIRVSAIEYTPSEGWVRAHGEILDYLTHSILVANPGIFFGKDDLWTSGPLSAKDKDMVIAKFTEFRKKGIAKKFFKMQ